MFFLSELRDVGCGDLMDRITEGMDTCSYYGHMGLSTLSSDQPLDSPSVPLFTFLACIDVAHPSHRSGGYRTSIPVIQPSIIYKLRSSLKTVPSFL